MWFAMSVSYIGAGRIDFARPAGWITGPAAAHFDDL